MSKAKDAEIVEKDSTAIAHRPAVEATLAEQAKAPAAILDLIKFGMEKGITVDAMERLQAMHARMSDRIAAQQLTEALAAFQSDVPPIPKTKSATDAERDGGRVLYKYAPLESIVAAIQPVLRSHGLMFRFDMDESPGGLSVTCVVSHIGGASMSSKFSTPVTSGTRIMSAPQKQAATVTYAKRQALINALGLTTCDDDTDGRDADGGLSDEQVARIEELLTEPLTAEDRKKFLAVYGAESVEALPASCFAAAERMLVAKRKGGAR